MNATPYFATVFLLAVSVSGCSLTLAGITALDNEREREAASIRSEEVTNLQKGTPIRIHQIGGTTLIGLYDSTHEESGEQVVSLTVEGQLTNVPLDQIERVESPRKKFTVWPALALGGVVDAAILVLFLSGNIGPAGPCFGC